ncbi:MAG: hypothetical protein IPK67_16465 [Planctomycetes bacterium]|nr:hypothetical protein [Planctomycetota bacterium]
MRRSLAWLSCAVLAAALWFWLSFTGGERAPTDPARGAGPNRPTLPPPAAEVMDLPVDRTPAPAPEANAPAEASAPEHEPPVEEVELTLEEDPLDPIEKGACALELTVVAKARSVLPPEGQVELWRLSAPGNEHWSEGDQLQASQTLERGFARFTELPTGQYRVRCSAERGGAPGPEPFEVACPTTTRTVEIELPRMFRVLLDVRDETGLPLDRGALAPATDSQDFTGPSWVRRRQARQKRGGHGISAMEWGNSGALTPILAGPEGFELGTHPESTTQHGRSRHATVHFEHRSSVRCPIRAAGVGDQHLLAVSVATEPLLDVVLTPDGRTLRELEATLDVDCTAVTIEPGAPPPDWRAIPLRVQVRCAGFEPLDFEATLAQWPPKVRSLVEARDG